MQPNTQNIPLIISHHAALEANNLNEKILEAIKTHLKNHGMPNDTDEILIEIPKDTCIVSHPYLGDKVEVAKVTLSIDADFLTIYYHDWEEESDLNGKNFSSLDLAKILGEIEKSIGYR